MRPIAGALTACLVLAAVGCRDTDGGKSNRGQTTAASAYTFPLAPAVADGPLDPEIDSALDRLLPAAPVGVLDRGVLQTIADSRDPRLAWLVSDLLRFFQGSRVEEDALVSAFERMTGVDPRDDPLFDNGSWRTVTDFLIAWDLPAPPRYRERKGVLHLGLEPGWKPFFDEADSDIDWRHVAWGGVLIDNRKLGDASECFRGCIPALDDPP